MTFRAEMDSRQPKLPRTTALFGRSLLAFSLCTTAVTAASPARFVKVSDHYYFLQSDEGRANVGALVTDEGVLLVDAPGERILPEVLAALKRITVKPVRWVVSTHPHEAHIAGNPYFADRNVAVIGSQAMQRLLRSMDPAGTERALRSRNRPAGEMLSNALFAPSIGFGRQMHIFAGGIEARILALSHKAHTGADLIVFVPAEKVLQVGDLFAPGSYPDIDLTADGSAAGWLDGMRQVIEFVPLLKSAMPQPKPPPTKTPEVEKTLEELITVIPGHGPTSNLQEMKDLLEVAQKLRAEVGRALQARRPREAFLSSSLLAPFRAYSNFDAYAASLYDALAKAQSPP